MFGKLNIKNFIMKTTKRIFLNLFFLFTLIACSKKDKDNSEEDALSNYTSQLCNNVSGVKAVYWDGANGLQMPLTEIPLLENTEGQFIHSQYPYLGFPLPRGYTGFEVYDELTATIGVNVIRNDNQVVWRYVPTTTFPGNTTITDVMAFEINQVLAFYQFTGSPQVLCTETRTSTENGLTTTFSARFINFGNYTALIWANIQNVEGLNSVFASTAVSVGQAAEYDDLIMSVFLPLNFQLLVNDNGVQDSDLDGTPDSQDNFPFDPTRQ